MTRKRRLPRHLQRMARATDDTMEPTRAYMEQIPGTFMRDPKVTLRNAPETYADFRGWLGHLRAQVLASGGDPLNTLSFLKVMEMKDEAFSEEALMQGLTRNQRSLDVRLYAGL